MFVLGIESSCDETAAAVVSEGRIYSNIIASQIATHAPYGGVVPEIASRKHLEAITTVIRTALIEADVKLSNIDGIAVTRGPGLVGSLLIGLSTAKAIAHALSIPIIGVNHLEGHIAAAFLSDKTPDMPFIALIVSGGHTSIYVVNQHYCFQLIGQTRDDAAGEAFDKAAKLLGLGYPGGIVIDRLAKSGDSQSILFPRAMKGSLDFSFSGLKTSLLTMMKRAESSGEWKETKDVAASFQEAIVDALVDKTINAAEKVGVRRIVVCGGVAANSRLREKFAVETQSRSIELFMPPGVLCTDNAAMIAAMGEIRLKTGYRDTLDMNAVSRWPVSVF